MSDHLTNRTGQDQRREISGKGTPRICIDVPLGTSYLEIRESIFRQAWQIAGTQLRAAVALGITPDTISRVLRRCERLKIGCPKVPEACPVIVPVNRIAESSGRKTDPAVGSSDDRSIDPKNQSPVALSHFSENEEGGSSSNCHD